ncbi:LytR/AlgR family response regulator transcription factor [Mangrovibacterium diazotrophicum]|uniref:LytTR family two component transcriptional regulator n=1 Tax=Mangrovibacterium diazotrophicum TaxID=1261403 RepID=A0A419W9S5_9BACT|nr:LytTR family DNA-binding domain-containing protein [Mangrovibacterium diazotrophicum]RKD92231.1 LytTR family two component transcriptional regulator [Mangrovibacterium diazotrophicum]
MKCKCIIVEDKPPALETIKNYANSLANLEVVGTFQNAFQAIALLNQVKIDLMFLDINILILLGTKVLSSILHPPKIIFTSEHKELAIEAFELDAVDYLLKPVSFERFLKAVNKFCDLDQTDQTNKNPDFLYFRSDRKMVKVFLNDVTYIESFKDYIVIHRLSLPALKVKYPIGSVENMLPQRKFLRIHRSFIVSISKVTAFTNNDVEIGTTELPIGRSYPEVAKRLTVDGAL